MLPRVIGAGAFKTRAYSQHGSDTLGNVGRWILQGRQGAQPCCIRYSEHMPALGTAYVFASEVGGEEKNIFTPNEMRRAATIAIA